MIWLSRPTKRLLLEMSVGVILWNVILAVLAVLFLPGFSYPVVPVILGLIVGAAGAMMMLVHMAVITERALDSQSENYASKLTVAQSLLRKVMFVAALFFFWRVLKIAGSGAGSHGNEGGSLSAAAGPQNIGISGGACKSHSGGSGRAVRDGEPEVSGSSLVQAALKNR